MTMDYVLLALGVICAGLGGELFIRGTVGIARGLRVSKGIIGATVTAFATSSPELSVAISSASEGIPEIALGDALGSNILNIALVLGITLLIGELQSRRVENRRNLTTAALAPVAVGLLAFDGMLSRLDGVILLAVFLVWIIDVTLDARRQRSAADEVLGERSPVIAWIEGIIGLAFLILAGRLIVAGATDIAATLGLGKFVIGAVIVAVGTSVPELATSVISKLRGHDEVSLGAILGSNIFNGLFIIGVASTISPITVVWNEVSLSLIIGIATVAMMLPSRSGNIERWRGAVLLALYVAYVAAIL